MNFGKTIKKLAAEINLALRIQKPFDAFKPITYPGTSAGVLKCRENNQEKYKHTSNLSNICNNMGEKYFYIPKTDLRSLKEIIEPEERKKSNIELPLRSITNNGLELPCNDDKEITEPVGIINSKLAKTNMLRVRRRKMRIHKAKKFARKFKFQRAKKKQEKQLRKEFNLQMGFKAMLKEGESYSPEKEVFETIRKVNWTKPVTKVRGLYAPDWVIKEHVELKKEEEILKERLEECEKYNKYMK